MMSLREAAAVLGARVSGDNETFTGVSTDTRTLKPGDLFVALRGERYDGHAYVAQARSAGAAAAMVDTQASDATGLPVLVVANTRAALGALAGDWRRRFPLPVVALTGSSGKTTVKEMLASILRSAAPATAEESVLATRGNLNNDIGMPLTLLELRPEHRYAVIEMGMNHAGEISYLTRIASPDVALITNAGTAHIEYLGSVEAIARAKGEIFEGLKEDGTAVINADDQYAPMWRELAGDRRRVEFGLVQSAGVTASYRGRLLESEIEISAPAGVAKTTLRAPGEHNVRNALAAAAAAIALDVPMNAIAVGLASYSGVKGRLQVRRSQHGATVIDDTYNANPESMRAAIAVLAQAPGAKILVLGDMGELGERAPTLHAELGVHAREAGIERLLTLGEHSAETARAFGRGARHYQRVEELVAEVQSALATNVTVLIKGSRFMRMERVVEAIVDAPPHAGRLQ
jgi:UDP-N-acetylmuramoyl-tripeptide--D-alanyl-D-alanine ligase